MPFSNNTVSAATNILQSVEAANASLLQAERTQRKGQESIADSNRSGGASSTNRVVGLQAIDKDVILPSESQEKEGAIDAQEQDTLSAKPQLPFPKIVWQSLQGIGAGQTGLIAIIGAVLALQAKTSSNFWSTLWQQASTSMMMEVQYAPIIGNAINAAYQAQSQATQAQASQSEDDGIVNLSMFGMTMVTAGVMEWKDPTKPTPTDDTTGFDKETKQPQANTGANPATPQAQTDQLMTDTDQTITKENMNNKQQAKSTGNWLLQKYKAGQARLVGFLGKGMSASNMTNQLGMAITGFFIDPGKLSAQATQQALEGQAQAVSKEAEQYSQFYGQDFGRMEDLRQGTQQAGIDTPTSLITQISNTITSTVQNEFRG